MFQWVIICSLTLIFIARVFDEKEGSTDLHKSCRTRSVIIYYD